MKAQSEEETDGAIAQATLETALQACEHDGANLALVFDALVDLEVTLLHTVQPCRYLLG